MSNEDARSPSYILLLTQNILVKKPPSILTQTATIRKVWRETSPLRYEKINIAWFYALYINGKGGKEKGAGSVEKDKQNIWFVMHVMMHLDREREREGRRPTICGVGNPTKYVGLLVGAKTKKDRPLHIYIDHQVLH